MNYQKMKILLEKFVKDYRQRGAINQNRSLWTSYFRFAMAVKSGLCRKMNKNSEFLSMKSHDVIRTSQEPTEKTSPTCLLPTVKNRFEKKNDNFIKTMPYFILQILKKLGGVINFKIWTANKLWMKKFKKKKIRQLRHIITEIIFFYRLFFIFMKTRVQNANMGG